MIMVILLAVLALVVVKALAHSPWGTFTVFATMPIAVFMGVYGRYLRPGQIGEMSLIDGAPRSATIIAETDTTCLMLTRTRFGKIVRDEPAVAFALLRTLAARVRKLEASPAD